MYNVSTLKSGLIGLIGWRQNPDPAGTQLNDILTSVSGIYYNDQHPLLTFENLKSIAPDFSLITYTAWSAVTTYAVGNIVSLSGVNYIAVAISLNQTPPNASYWAVYSPLTVWLKEKTEAAIIWVIEDWIGKKFEVKTAKSLIGRTQTFMNAVRLADLDEDTGQLVGFEMVPHTSRNTVAVVEAVALSLSQNQTLTVYCFASNRVTPLYSQAVDYTGAGAEQWQTVNWELPAGPAYYICYAQDDLTGQSVNTARSYSRDEGGEVTVPFETRGLVLSAFRSPDGDTSELWDVAGNIYTTSTNYGLNFRLNVRCDYTTFLLEQKDLFKGPLAKGVAMRLLREIAYNANTRVNRNAGNYNAGLKEILYEIDGDSQSNKKQGLRYDYDMAIRAADFNDASLDKQCLPCRRRGVKYRTV
jgi:hypothetical protein